MTMVGASQQDVLTAHLASWGLKRWTSDTEYFAWQRQALSPEQLNALHRGIALKRQGTASEEAAFYDATAETAILPVLYSQRYDYYQAIGPRVVTRMEHARTVLDFGCGVGILTTFYASQCPDKTFVGIDRSPLSIARAQEQAEARGLKNVRFECVDGAQGLAGSYDLILATHALVQAEQDHGLPSRDWTTFERATDPEQQQNFERRTGIDTRLDRFRTALAADGRLIVFEKTRQLARRVPFQRALAARGLSLMAPPESLRYRLVEEVVDDGPLYVLGKAVQERMVWDESPEPDEGPPFKASCLRSGSADAGAPLYENHWPSAQHVWERLTARRVAKETTRQEPDGRQLHVELGTIEEHAVYLYCANTFDQRQLVVMKQAQREALEQYYAEILAQTWS